MSSPSWALFPTPLNFMHSCFKPTESIRNFQNRYECRFIHWNTGDLTKPTSLKKTVHLLELIHWNYEYWYLFKSMPDLKNILEQRIRSIIPIHWTHIWTGFSFSFLRRERMKLLYLRMKLETQKHRPSSA